ncbi:MAG: hypothetical protein DI533_04585 [Cereibacter sphaeroides]|uniref:Uncharacterized protein n=1 Tax=Cereibacter sphaeroides TaxID=1063 RepID=A0A2W5U9A3_CERSP|nr:MAG: hypothetical protein DI533_04585 [Cereibacter sphaeroides]
MQKHLTPVEVCERLIGAPEKIAVICGLHEKSVYPWRRPSTGRDAGEIPSSRHMRLLLAYAAARNIPLTAEHLIWGAPAAEIEALLAAMQGQVAAE